MVDDHIVTQDAPRRSSANARREDDEILERSDMAYAAERLKPKESKRFRKKTKFTAIGAQVDGVRLAEHVQQLGQLPGKELGLQARVRRRSAHAEVERW